MNFLQKQLETEYKQDAVDGHFEALKLLIKTK
jgi:hypothetical protein